MSGGGFSNTLCRPISTAETHLLQLTELAEQHVSDICNVRK